MHKPISKSQFKAQALEYFRRVEKTGEELIVTDKGRPSSRSCLTRTTRQRPCVRCAGRCCATTSRRLRWTRRPGSRSVDRARHPAPDWIARSEALPFLRFVPVDTAIAVRSVDLAGPLHDDPADRIVIATTLSLGAELITRDERIRRYTHVKTVW